MAERFELTFDNLKAWCQRQGYQFSENAEAGQIAVHYQLLGEPAPLMILPQPQRGMVMLVMKQPYVVPADRRAAVVEGAGLLNSTLLMGAWFLNRDTGELFFRATCTALDTAYSDQAFLHVARVVVGTSERAAPAFRAVALEGAEPAKAIGAVV